MKQKSPSLDQKSPIWDHLGTRRVHFGNRRVHFELEESILGSFLDRKSPFLGPKESILRKFGPNFHHLFSTITEKYRVIEKNSSFLVKKCKNWALLLVRHLVFPKINYFGTNFYHLFATIAQNYRVFLKNSTFLVKKGKIRILLLTGHHVFQKISVIWT